MKHILKTAALTAGAIVAGVYALRKLGVPIMGLSEMRAHVKAAKTASAVADAHDEVSDHVENTPDTGAGLFTNVRAPGIFQATQVFQQPNNSAQASPPVPTLSQNPLNQGTYAPPSRGISQTLPSQQLPGQPLEHLPDPGYGQPTIQADQAEPGEGDDSSSWVEYDDETEYDNEGDPLFEDDGGFDGSEEQALDDEEDFGSGRGLIGLNDEAQTIAQSLGVAGRSKKKSKSKKRGRP